MSQKIALITVVYQNYSVLKDLFDSLKKQSNNNFHVYIADLSITRKEIQFQGLPITVINGENKGYSHGVNLCLAQADKDKISLYGVINNDIIVAENFIEELQRSFTSYPNSVIGGKIYYAPGFEYHKSRYNKSDLGKVFWYAGGTIDWNNVFIKHRGVDEIDHGQYDKPERTDFITGCLLCFNKKVLDKIGYWNEKYFLYFEDADYCEQAKRKDVPLIYNPKLVIWHKNAQSTEGSGSNIHTKYQRKNRIRFGLKYAPIKTKLHLLPELFSP
ncbi:MAG: glycosyltransferase family 2 protein [Patescibacteria group bacterium]|jgi:hypothetical protein